MLTNILESVLRDMLHFKHFKLCLKPIILFLNYTYIFLIQCLESRISERRSRIIFFYFNASSIVTRIGR